MAETFSLDPRPGAFPYRYTQDDRFQYRVKVQPVADYLEFDIRPVDTRLPAMAAQRQWMGCPKRLGPKPDTDRDGNLARAVQRARSTVRLMCIELKVDRMLTFTIRKWDGVALDYETVLKAWDLFRRMAVRWDPTFAYVAAPEEHKKGGYHIHAGIHGYVNINIIRRMWQSALNRVMGRAQSLIHGEDSPGTVNISHRPIRGDQMKRSCKVASYIAKYLGKSLEVEFNRKRYFHTKGIKLTPAQRLWLEAEDRESALVEVIERYGLRDWFEVEFWRRDGQSVWFRVPVASIPPPF